MTQLLVAAACCVLAFLAYFSLDEIQRQNEMRAWYYGGPVALALGLVPLMLLMSNAMLETMAGFLPHASQVAASPKTYVVLGVAMTVGMQFIGHYIARTIFAVLERAR
jgi:uncharacterized membrane protein